MLGLRIRLSEAHPEDDICDELEGDYPKTFMWRGWHPRCMCSISPILMDRKSEEWKKLRAMSDEDYKKYQSPNLVKNVPEKFKTWCDTNKDKLNAAREKGKLPYFVRDNEKVVGEIVGWKTKKELIMEAAKARHEARTDEQINDILSRWDERKYSIAQRENFRSMEKTWGIKREVSMDFEKANQGRGNINYSKGNAYKVNCQSSVVAHELRLRGFDVTAQPNWKIDDDPNKLSSGTWQCWKNQDGTPMQMPEAFAFKFKGFRMSGIPVKETVQLIEEHTQDVGRYHVSFSWKGRRYGHIVTMERKADGTALWYDPQSGKRDFFDKEYAKKILYVRAYRVDNLLFDPKWNVVRPLAKEALETSYNEAVANYVRLNGEKPKYKAYGIDGEKKGLLKYKEKLDAILKDNNIPIHQSRLEAAIKSKNDIQKFEKEYNMCKVVVKNGHKIEMLGEGGDDTKFDVLFDKKRGELKSVQSTSNLGKRVHEAIHQGAEVVIFEFKGDDIKSLKMEIQKYRNRGIDIYYYVKDEDVLIHL